MYSTFINKDQGKTFRIVVFTLSIILLTTTQAISQQKQSEAPPFKDRLFYGGNFGLQLGTITNIEISPVVGYWLLPRIAVAVGPTYRFYKYYSNKTNIFGARSYAEVVVLRDIEKFVPVGMNTSIFFHFEDEMLSLDSEYWQNVTYPPKRFIENNLFAGGGISQAVGGRSSINLMVLWPLTENKYEIYSVPEFRITFIF